MSFADNNLSEQIKRANRAVYNNIIPEKYNSNESIFNDKRRDTIRKILEESAQQAGNLASLDIGCGTGNVLRISQNIFAKTYGVDISEILLTRIAPSFPNSYFVASDAENLPFKNESFNCISCYALLHHIYSHEMLFNETYRILKPGGILYTDHDPNYFLHRFYRLFYKMKYSKKPGFSSETEELAEYHNTSSPGINPEKLCDTLIQTGFRKVKIGYRITDRSDCSFFMKILLFFLKTGSFVCPCVKSFYTHFFIVAEK